MSLIPRNNKETIQGDNAAIKVYEFAQEIAPLVARAEFIAACFVNQGRSRFSYEYLLSENERLTTEAKNHAYELECVRNRHISDLQSLVRDSARMQKTIESLKAENQELKSQIEQYEIQNAGEA